MKLIPIASLSLLTLVSLSARADYLNLAPGTSQWVGNTYVTCVAQQLDPIPAPPPVAPAPPPTHIERIVVRANLACLQGIQPTDGKALMKAANRCADGNPAARVIDGSCSRNRALDTHADLAEDVIRRATTVIYEDQKNAIRDDATDWMYSCVRPGLGYDLR